MIGRPFAVPADDLPDPAMLVAPDGQILAANQATAAALGIAAHANGLPRLADLVADPPERVADYLRRCAAVGSPLPGRLTFRRADGAAAFRCEGHRIPEPALASPVICLRCRPEAASNQSFAALNEKIEQLGREISARMRTEAQLTVLINELHHRIRNTLQTIASLARLQAAADRDRAVTNALTMQARRVQTIGAVYRKLYWSEELARIDIRGFIEGVCAEQARAGGGPERAWVVENEVAQLSLDAAVPFALAVNEIIAVALRQPGPADDPVRVSFRSDEDRRLALRVQSEGLDTWATGGGDFSLTVVRALAGQLGARLQATASAVELTFHDQALEQAG